MTGLFTGVGVGPGDPELITLKAARLIRDADVVSYIAKAKGESQARSIARLVLSESRSDQLEIPIEMPMSEDRSIANQVYDDAANRIQSALDEGKQVVFLCEGDPLFFGSFAYLLDRLKKGNVCQVIPGISSVHAASAALCKPLTKLKESFAVVSGRHSESYLVGILNNHDTVVIMKAGRSRTRILNALELSDRTGEAEYLEYIGRDNERIEHDVSVLKDRTGPYFSIFVVTRSVRDKA